MSWNSFYTDDIEPTVVGKFQFCWTCPRCGFLQTVDVNVVDVLHGQYIACQNTQMCGDGESKFELILDVTLGSYKGLMDRPLNVV